MSARPQSHHRPFIGAHFLAAPKLVRTFLSRPSAAVGVLAASASPSASSSSALSAAAAAAAAVPLPEAAAAEAAAAAARVAAAATEVAFLLFFAGGSPLPPAAPGVVAPDDESSAALCGCLVAVAEVGVEPPPAAAEAAAKEVLSGVGACEAGVEFREPGVAASCGNVSRVSGVSRRMRCVPRSRCTRCWSERRRDWPPSGRSYDAALLHY